MAIFNRSNGTDYVTREEGARALNDLHDLTDRVSALEGLAQRLGATVGQPHRSQATAAGEASAVNPNYDRSGMPAAARGEDVPAGRAATPRVTTPTGVDYGAVAFGLSEIKRKTTDAFGGGAAAADIAREYEGAVQYFADVFAKTDPAFNVERFKRDAGV